jgi:hypothetical protein
MTLVPSPRLIWATALAGFPLAIAGAVVPAARTAVEVAGGILVAGIAADALLRKRALAGLRIELPELERFFKDRDGSVRVRVHNSAARARRIGVGIAAPAGIEAAAEEQRVDLPDGAPAADFEWRCTPRRRGR